ncbi:MAG: hypothetical protein HYU38_12280, partial [Candidatus Tectomicrobia bacterium]|nr:hypothetical protein [Candidatus Tectomicrobia bacterium]
TVLRPEGTVSVLVKRLEAPQAKIRLKLSNPLQAPLAKGQKVGEIEAVLGDQVIAKTALLATEDVPRMSILDRLMFWR